MRLILVGCEYAGKTTLAGEIVDWIERTFGSSRTFHDHFSLPCNEFPVEEQEQLLALSPRLKEMFQRYMMNYHFHSAFYSDPDHNLVGFHLEEAVYAPLYYGYGGRGEYGDRAALARAFDEEVMQHAPRHGTRAAAGAARSHCPAHERAAARAASGAGKGHRARVAAF